MKIETTADIEFYNHLILSGTKIYEWEKNCNICFTIT